MALSNPTEANARFIDKTDTFQLVDAVTVISELTDSSGGSTDGTIAAISGSGADTDINNNFADITDKVNKILQVLASQGLMKDA